MQNILLIQNDSADSEAVRNALVNSNDGLFRVVRVRDCSEGLAALAKRKTQGFSDANRIVAVLVDLSLPDSSGIETFDRIFQAAPQVLSGGTLVHSCLALVFLRELKLPV